MGKMISEITSSSNSKYKYIKSLMQKKERIKNGEFSVEGKKSAKEAIIAGRKLSMIAVSDDFYLNENFEYPEHIPIYKMPNQLFNSLCDTQTPQGILVVIKMEKNLSFFPCEDKIYIYCDGVTDPGNMGTIIRTADSIGAGAVLLSDGCVDIYNPKTVRSTMGSIFNIDILENISIDDLLNIKQLGFQIVSGALGENTIEYTECNLKIPTILVVGNEANGISKEILSISDKCVKIPIIGRAESLNVSIAAAILMYEALRQRRNKD